jgi:hypothetical protein
MRIAPTALSSDRLAIYLNDHLAGATFGTELARRAAGPNRGTEFEAELEQLATDIDADRAELERIMDTLGKPRDQIKPRLAWAAEKAGRLKPNGQLTGYSPLSRVIELEGLASGVQGKLLLWRALRTIAPQEPGLGVTQLDRLISRAESQLDRVGALRRRAVELALARDSGG